MRPSTSSYAVGTSISRSASASTSRTSSNASIASVSPSRGSTSRSPRRATRGRASAPSRSSSPASGRGPVIRAEAAAADKYAALDLAYGRLEERLRRAADRRNGKYRKNSVAPRLLGGRRRRGGRDDPGRLRGRRRLRGRTDRGARQDAPEHADDRRRGAARARARRATTSSCSTTSTAASPTVVYKRRGYDYGLMRIAARRVARRRGQSTAVYGRTPRCTQGRYRFPGAAPSSSQRVP